MLGHQALQAMRRSRMKPAIVFVDVDSPLPSLPRLLQWQNVDERLAEIDVQPGESIARIDWRPLVGLVVHVSGLTEDRVREAAQAIEKAGAKRVISTLMRHHGKGEWATFKTVWVEDTLREPAHG
jgi:hypothetical protein